MSDQPQIKYVKAHDGVRIAYWMAGTGYPLINLPPMPYSNCLAEWTFPPQRAYYDKITPEIQLIRFDCRGAGLSDREVADYSIEAHAQDVLAVADAEGLRRFAVLGFGHSGGLAVHLAANYPERVSHLILWCCYPRAAEYGRGSRVKAIASLMDEDWEFWTRAEAFHLTDYEGGSYSNWTMKYIRESLTEEGSKAAVEVLRQVDVTPLLPKVQAPTLIFHRAGIRSITVEMAREMAATIPNARLVMLDGSWIVPYLPDGGQDVADAWRAFLREPGYAPREAASLPASLTPREVEVLRLVAAGRTSKEISADLTLSIRTVGRHITNIYTKIGARTRADATAYAIRHDLA